MAQTLLDYNQATLSWTKGCGCGGKQKETIALLPDTRPVFIQKNGRITGPVTGIEYVIYPNTTSLNIATADAEFWLASGDAKEPINGWKGHLTRE